MSKISLKRIEDDFVSVEETKEEKYIYVDPPKIPQVPKDIIDLEFQ